MYIIRIFIDSIEKALDFVIFLFLDFINFVFTLVLSSLPYN